MNATVPAAGPLNERGVGITKAQVRGSGAALEAQDRVAADSVVPLLSVQNLSVNFETSRGDVAAVRDLSFDVRPGETVALVGESGSGKSTTALSLLRLLPTEGCRIEGRIQFNGQDLLTLPLSALRQVRGKSVGMIFQDPSMALNPVFSIGDQLVEPLQMHLGLSRRDALDRCVSLLKLVRVTAPEERLSQYPHNLSGGMRQRIMIAMALACRPSLLIADEPTTALDVTVQADVLAMIDELKRAMGMSVLLITHDLGVVWETASRVVVMYAGRKVEEGPVDKLLTAPAHPYSAGLLQAAQWEDQALAADAAPGASPRSRRFFEIPGTVPSAFKMPPGCAFAPRCSRAQAVCSTAVPGLRDIENGHEAACLFPEISPR